MSSELWGLTYLASFQVSQNIETDHQILIVACECTVVSRPSQESKTRVFGHQIARLPLCSGALTSYVGVSLTGV